MRITSKGQVTIPREIRERARLLPHSEVEFTFVDGVVTLRLASGRKPAEAVIARMRGRGDINMTTDEIKALTRAE